jgi:SAM-dependent methyltransferase
MTKDHAPITQDQAKLAELVGSQVYRQNLEFWDRAWNMVKTPYTQMPDLPYLQRIPSLLQEQKTRTVLDLGCGSGWLSIFLARLGLVVTGIDIAEHAIDLARSWAAQEHLDVKFEVCDIANIHFSEGAFDAVVANSIFEHLTYDMAKITLLRLRTLLVAGGIFIGCFDKVGGGPGEYYALSDGTHVYTDKARKGMLLRYFSDEELRAFFQDWVVTVFDVLPSGSRFVCARA